MQSWRTEYPFTSHWLALAEGRVHYVDECTAADRGSAEVLLLVHGNPTWSFHWRELIRAWRTQYRVVALDHLGCGLSDKPAGKPYRLAGRVEHLVQLVDQLDLRGVTLVAQDWGGAIGLGAVEARPERFGRLVLLNTGAFPPWFVPWRLRLARLPVVARLAIQGGNLFSRAALRMTMAGRRALPRAVRAGYLAPYDSWSHRRAVYDFVQDIPTSTRHPTYQSLADIEARLPALADRPVLLVWGMRDWCFTAECLEKFMEYFPRATVHRLEQAGHWVVEDAPEQVAALVLEFLAAQPLKRQTS